MMRERPWLWGLVALAAALGLVYVLGAANPVAPPPISTDALGPEPGESAAQYLDHAAESLRVEGPAPRWALVSPTAPSSSGAAAAAAGGVRISRALFWSAAAGEQAPVVSIETGQSADPAGLLQLAQVEAAIQLESSAAAAVADNERSATVADLRDGCACVVGLLVRGTPEELRGIADQPGVRAVEALPADAVYGRFAVRTLLP